MPSPVESEHVFLAICHPLDGPLQGQGKVGDGHVFGEDAALLAKATADIRRDDAHPALWPVEHSGELPAHPVWSLGGGPDGEEVFLGLVMCYQAACFEPDWSQALHLIALPDDPIRLRKGGVQVMALSVMADTQRDISPQVLMDGTGILSGRFQGVEDRLQRFVIDLDAIHGIPCHIAVAGY